MNPQMLKSLMGNLDEETAQGILDQLDDDEVRGYLVELIDNAVVPHFDEIKQKAQETESRQQVRERYANLSQEEQEENFHSTVADLVAISQQVREHPRQGMSELKGRLRDPWVMESLLLIFENPRNINPEYADQMKEFCTYMTRWAGMNLAPEMYTRDEAEDLVEQLFPNQDPEEVLGPPPGEGGDNRPEP